MKSTRLLFLASVLVCNLMTARGGAQSISSEEEPDPRTTEDLLLRRAESLLLRSILRKIPISLPPGGLSAQAAWVAKRQHPGKRRTEDGAEEADEEYSDVERRQHPGKRAATGRPLATVVQGELSKRQHPGKRYAVVTRSRRQHPGKRQPDRGEEEEEEEEGEEEEEEEEHHRLPELHRRQHPGKRFWDRPGSATTSPCEDLWDPARCAKTDLLLHFLDDISDVKRGEEKRQHPGKRFAPEEEQ
uniref:Pro-thyrotropin-releasing hormone n=1 Tax=Hippocampus comes TaxID=109280 RepID=A0A3Q2YUC2_HIPCM